MKHKKLELTWVGKGEKITPEARIFIEKPEYSYAADSQGQIGLEDTIATTDNMLIHGDNLLALRSLQRDYAGKVKCIYIDPPYN